MRANRRRVIAIFSLMLGLGIGASSVFSASTVQAADQRMIPFAGNTIADIAEKASPAIVHLEMRHKVQMNAQGYGGVPISEFFFNGQRVQIPNFFEMQQDEQPEAQPGKKPDLREQLSKHPDIASGFIIRPDGYILTNAHAVNGQDAIKVTLYDKRSFDAKVVGVDQFSDLAVVKIDAKDLPTLPWGSSSSLRPGEFAVAIGSPSGEDHTVTLGIISAVARKETDVNENINFVQTDAAINPGNSGGPLLNLNCEVVAVNTAIRKFVQNISYSIPSDIAKSVSEQLIANGKVLRPWLGVTMSELDDTYIKGVGLPDSTKGVIIRTLVQGGPALASGLKQYDIIQKIDGKEMFSPKDVKDFVQSRQSGDVLNFIVLRDKKIEAVPVNVGTYHPKTPSNH